jgi:hypothetical protein
MYQGRYQSYEGKVKFLDDLVTEEVFYQEALDLGLEDDPVILKKAQNQIQSTYYTEYKNHLIETRIQIEDGELYEYFLENVDEYPGITFDEAKTMVEKKYRSEKAAEFIENYDQKLWDLYEIEINEALLDSLDLNDSEALKPIADQKYLTSNDPQLEKTIADLKEFYEGLPNTNKRPFLQADSRLNSIKEMTKMSLYYQEAIKEGFEDNEVVRETMPMLVRNLMLRETYNRLVTDRLDVTDETVKDYYDNNIEKFSTKAYRKIQAFGFEDEKTAKNQRKHTRKALKKDDSAALNEVLESSVFEFKNGEIDYIYKNNIIPKIGTDSIWCDMVWQEDYGKTDPRELSDVFQNAKGDYVFFRVLEDHVPLPTPYEEAKVKIENEMRQDNSRKLFEQENKRLREKFQVVVYEDNLVEKLTPEEYFTKAEAAQKKRRYKDAIYYYDQICQYYENGSDDYKAMFMKAFLYSEEMNEKDKAISIFEELLQKYPQGDLRESAEFMIEELQGKSDILQKMEENK